MLLMLLFWTIELATKWYMVWYALIKHESTSYDILVHLYFQSRTGTVLIALNYLWTTLRITIANSIIVRMHFLFFVMVSKAHLTLQGMEMLDYEQLPLEVRSSSSTFEHLLNW
jgi:hypothetical protein